MRKVVNFVLTGRLQEMMTLRDMENSTTPSTEPFLSIAAARTPVNFNRVKLASKEKIRILIFSNTYLGLVHLL